MAYQKLGSFDDAYIKQSSPSSYQQIQAAKSAWEAANAAGDRAGMDAAHQAAESIRAAYGYSGGVDGSQYLPNSYAPVRSQYMDAANAAAQAYRLAAQQGASQLEARRPQIQADYDALAKQTYINYMKEKQALPETMAKLGITGQGAAESTAASQSSHRFFLFMVLTPLFENGSLPESGASHSGSANQTHRTGTGSPPPDPPGPPESCRKSRAA